MVRKKIIIGITMGDPAGIGPEIIVRYFQENNPHRGYNILIIGDRSIFDEIAKRINVYPSSNFHFISSFSEARFDGGLINVFDEYSANFYLRYIGQRKCLKCLTLFCIYVRVITIVFSDFIFSR